MIVTETIEVRNLAEDETIPLELHEGIVPGWNFDKEWTWIALLDGEIIGYLLAGQVQGIVLLMVLKSKDKHTIVLPRLLRKFLKDCLARGFKGWMVHLNREKKEQMKLLRIALRAGAVVFPYSIVCAGGRIADATKW